VTGLELLLAADCPTAPTPFAADVELDPPSVAVPELADLILADDAAIEPCEAPPELPVAAFFGTAVLPSRRSVPVNVRVVVFLSRAVCCFLAASPSPWADETAATTIAAASVKQKKIRRILEAPSSRRQLQLFCCGPATWCRSRSLSRVRPRGIERCGAFQTST
jgi:hypothetical protein